jgi:hypothetical protein
VVRELVAGSIRSGQATVIEALTDAELVSVLLAGVADRDPQPPGSPRIMDDRVASWCPTNRRGVVSPSKATQAEGRGDVTSNVADLSSTSRKSRLSK